MNNSKLLSKVLFGASACVISIFGFMNFNVDLFSRQQVEIQEEIEQEEKYNDFAAHYGLDLLGDYDIVEGTIEPNQFLSTLLTSYEVPYTTIHNLQHLTKDLFDLRKIKAGQDYVILRKDECAPAEYFIYTPDRASYVVFELSKNPQACIHLRDKKIEIDVATGEIQSSLYATLMSNDLSSRIAGEMESILESSIDFHHLQKGDNFKILYERVYIDGEPVSSGNIHAITFVSGNQTYQAYKFDHEKFGGYYDEEGRAMKKSFLMSPVKYSRISSYYNKSRLHPVLKTVRPHYGTDYAAPHGTEIYAVADGKVTRAAFGRGNGNYVKIKHDDVYETQYLHMSRFAKGIKPGVMVKQGDVIGYVGSTGLATGPHVCFRFWKNGVQVNHLKEKLPKTEKLKEEVIQEFMIVKEELNTRMESMLSMKHSS